MGGDGPEWGLAWSGRRRGRGTVAWASVKVFSGKNASLIAPSESLPANAPIPITLEGVSAWPVSCQIEL